MTIKILGIFLPLYSCEEGKTHIMVSVLQVKKLKTSKLKLHKAKEVVSDMAKAGTYFNFRISEFITIRNY